VYLQLILNWWKDFHDMQQGSCAITGNFEFTLLIFAYVSVNMVAVWINPNKIHTDCRLLLQAYWYFLERAHVLCILVLCSSDTQIIKHNEFFWQCSCEVSHTLWAGPLISPETQVALAPTNVHDKCNKQSFIQSCYILCQNDTTPYTNFRIMC